MNDEMLNGHKRIQTQNTLTNSHRSQKASAAI